MVDLLLAEELVFFDLARAHLRRAEGDAGFGGPDLFAVEAGERRIFLREPAKQRLEVGHLEGWPGGVRREAAVGQPIDKLAEPELSGAVGALAIGDPFRSAGTLGCTVYR